MRPNDRRHDLPGLRLGRRMLLALTATVLGLAMLVACQTPSANTASSHPMDAGTGAADATRGPAKPTTDSAYLSLGDSYAAGYQPEPIGSGAGFAQQIAQRSTTTADPLTLYNLGCPGATTAAVLEDKGCPTANSVSDAWRYDSSSQLDAALALIQAQKDEVRLVTLSLGGNDMRPCLEQADPVACSRTVAPAVARNLKRILKEVRQAIGPDVPIVGITYPDVWVKDLASPEAAARARSEASVQIFRDVLNPTLATAYASVDAGFVDITAESGAYSPAEASVQSPHGAKVPAAVAAVCQYTHYCDSGDVHPTTAGYGFIADRIIALLTENEERSRP